MIFQLNYEITKIITIASEKGKDVGEGLKELGIDYCPYPIKEPVRTIIDFECLAG